MGFKVVGRKTFDTLHEENGSANIILSLKDQEVLCEINKAVYPVANTWALQGWTTFDLQKIPHELALDALNTASKNVCDKKKK